MSKHRLGNRAVCKACQKPIEWQGYWWRHTDYTPRHPAQPTEGTLSSPLSELESQRSVLLAACERAEQMLRNLTAFLDGDCLQIAANESRNLQAAIAKAKEE